jgi:hypothetical protein
MAKAWLDPHTPVEQASCFAQEAGLPPNAFEWHRVSSRVCNRYVDDASVMEPDHKPPSTQFTAGASTTDDAAGATERRAPQDTGRASSPL